VLAALLRARAEANSRARAIADQPPAFVLQIEEVVGVAGAVIMQRGFQQSGRLIGPGADGKNAAAEEVVVGGDGITWDLGGIASSIAGEALRKGAALKVT
jgi:hypothetical protein